MAGSPNVPEFRSPDTTHRPPAQALQRIGRYAGLEQQRTASGDSRLKTAGLPPLAVRMWVGTAYGADSPRGDPAVGARMILAGPLIIRCRGTVVTPTPFSWRYERARCGQLWPGGQAALRFKVAELVGCACLSEHSPLMASARNAIRGHGRGGFCGL